MLLGIIERNKRHQCKIREKIEDLLSPCGGEVKNTMSHNVSFTTLCKREVEGSTWILCFRFFIVLYLLLTILLRTC